MEETPLAFAAGIGNVDIVQALITERADVNRICSVNHCTHVILHIICIVYIRESVDSLCRDGADTPIVRVHRKAFLTRERSRSKPFWAPSYSIPVVRYPTIPPK